MDGSRLERFKKRFAEIQDDLQRLKEQSAELNTAIESGRLVLNETAEQLEQTLRSYQEQLASLQAMGEELSIPTGGSLSDISSSLLAAEERERLNVERHLLLDYFRLTAEADEVRSALEESKRRLMEKCRLAADERKDALKPFIVVIKRTAEGKGRLPDDEYDAIEQGISRAVARALDRHDLSIDPDLEIDGYLDSSCALLTPENSSGQATQMSPKPEPEPEPQPEQEATPQRRWPDFSGYVDPGSVEFGKDTPAGDLRVSRALKMFRDRGETLIALLFLQNQILLESSDINTGDDDYYVPSGEILDYLLKKGYLTEITVKKGEEIRSFLTLSSMGWACFKKSDIISYIKGDKIRASSLLIPTDLRVGPSDLTTPNVLHLVAFHDYFLHKPTREVYTVFCAAHHFLFSGTRSNGDHAVLVAIFEAGNEEKGIQELQDWIDVKPSGKAFHIIVSSKKDIPILERELDFSKADKNQVRYCLLDGPSLTLLDHDGQPVDPAKPEVPTEPEPQPGPEPRSEPEPQPRPEAQPEPEPQPEPGPEADLRQTYIQKGWELLARGKDPEALTLFRALSRYSEEDEQLYKQLAYALDDPSFRKNYRSAELIQVFPDGQTGELGYDALELAAYLRLFFSRDIQSEQHHDVKNIVPALEGNAAYSEVPQLKELAYKLGKMFSEMEHGFEPEALNFLTNAKGREEQVNEYRKKARSLLDSRLEEGTIGNVGVRKTRRALFGSGSELRDMLEKAAAGNAADAPAVRKTMEKYQDGGFIDDLLDTTWEEMGGYRKGKKLTGSARKTILNKFQEIIDTCLTWATLSEASGGSNFEEDKEKYIRYQTEAKELCTSAESALEAKLSAHEGREAAVLGILSSTLKELRERLEGKFDVNRDRFYFISFLKGNFVELGEDLMPFMESDYDEVSPFSLCKRIVKQSEMEDRPWEDTLRRIFEDDEEGRDYGHARLIREYLTECQQDFVWPEKYNIEEDAPRSKAKLQSEHDRFIARLDMAENYGWVESISRIDAITADMEKRCQRCNETQNYGFCLRTMGAYWKQLEREAEKYKAPLKARLKKLRAEEDHPIWDYIEQLIEKRMYTVAQDYIKQAQDEGWKERPESALLEDGNDALEQFVGNYTRNYNDAKESDARGARETTLVEIYDKRHRHEKTNSRLKTGSDMLRAWPRSPGRANAGKIKSLFVNMGLPVKDVEARDDRRFFVTFDEKGPVADYPHPIGAYGSEMVRKGLHVFLVFGLKDATTMNSSIRSLSISAPSVILADTQLSLPEKRKLAMAIKQKNQNRTPYLIIDRVTILYLAEQQQSERWKVFLKCALPFHYLNPFREDSSKICPDMFIGRRYELEQVITPGRANIIYGGRQLGKTALLHHAQQLEDVHSEGKWSVFIDIKTESAPGAAARIYEKLQDEGFLPSDKADGNIDWPALARKIINRIKNGTPKVEKFLLLLDEADNFLVDCQKFGYEPIDHLKRIQDETENRFKFVLAGLHNVIRFYDRRRTLGSNSPLAQLSSITIRPLPFREAEELLEKPLSYIGFRLRSENTSLIAQILSSANYYPGLLQFYASRLVKSICEGDYGNFNEKPPYELDENRILTLLKDKEFKNNIRDKFMITLGIEEEGYYETLAYSLAYCYYYWPDDLARGYTAEQIVEMCGEFHIRSIVILEPDKVKTLLDELSELNILRKNEIDERYTFNRVSFRHMLGDEEIIYEKLNEKGREDSGHAE